MRIASFVVVAALLAGAAGAQEPAPGEAPESGPPLFEEVHRTVKRGFYDKTFGGRDWDAIRLRFLPRARAVADDHRALRRVINEMLGVLKTSHLALIEPEVFEHHFQPEMSGEATPQYGVEWVKLPQGVFVAGVWEGGPAERAGIKRGDRLMSIEGKPPLEHPRFLPAGSDPGFDSPPGYYLVPDGKPVELTVARRAGRPDGRHEPEPPASVRIEPEAMTMTEASRRSLRVIEHRGKRIGYVHFWHFLNRDMVDLLQRGLEGAFKDCDALILDVRGRGGSPLVLFRLLRMVTRAKAAGPPWAGRCATLIDEGSRSAKEVWAWRYKKQAIGPVIGRRTEGAVIAAQFRPMQDGSALMLAMSDVRRMSGGENLEGVGVAPHFHIDGRLPYSAGYDEILQGALKILWEKFGLATPAKEEDVERPFHAPRSTVHAPRCRAA